MRKLRDICDPEQFKDDCHHVLFLWRDVYVNQERVVHVIIGKKIQFYW